MIQKDSLELNKLYDFGKKVHLFRSDEDKENSKKYRDIYLPLIKKVPEIPGWYLLCRVNSEEVKEIYIGASKSLRDRLYKLLKDDYVIFWMKNFTDSETLNTLSNFYKKKYNANIKRAKNKFGANKIFWFGVEEVTRGELYVVKKKLINRLYEHSLFNELKLFDEIEKVVDSELRKHGRYKGQ